ncbi:TRAP transporter small permease subunit [Rubrimonas cliftonensis]|uniref:TRAP transporter small permease protein n=1 Tax=Rubrimonas cliftonensis TaxID=89524 RepID=A0A1H3W213_9RHOB|nr:TRAP transporter small permease subunit [Rubrimonas cliftonensis]SDZ81010.1 TRAP-type mannitol/chloroaromatic compound transport system, small permease component [Rubrimonas cliftonensis]
MHAVYKAIDGLNDRIGRFVAWFTLAMVLIQFALVVARYVFSANDLLFLSSLWWQESIVYLHGALIMSAAGYTFLHNGHVRVDIFYRTASQRSQDWTDLVGSLLFLLPVCWLIAWSAWPNVALSWRNFEGSTETSGIPFKYLLKSTVLLLAALLALQAVSTALKAALRLMDEDVVDPYRAEESLD